MTMTLIRVAVPYRYAPDGSDQPAAGTTMDPTGANPPWSGAFVRAESEEDTDYVVLNADLDNTQIAQLGTPGFPYSRAS